MTSNGLRDHELPGTKLEVLQKDGRWKTFQSQHTSGRAALRHTVFPVAPHECFVVAAGRVHSQQLKPHRL